jgi:hypothetical protein
MGGETWRNGLNSPRKLLILSLFVIALSQVTFAASAANIYITPNGTAQGACTTNPQTPAWFNSSANWGSGANQIGPGTTVHLCGTITTNLTLQGSGSSGSSITIYFESGASISPTLCGGNGCLNAVGRSYILVDGGTPCGWVNQVQIPCNGTIQNTTSQPSSSSFGVVADGCSNCEFRDLNIGPIYQHVQGGANPSSDLRGIQNLGGTATGATYLVHNNIVHDSSSGIVYVPSGSNDNGLQVYNNSEYNINSSLDISNNNNGTLTAAQVHDNQFGSTAAWDSPGCGSHHNSMHAFAYTTTNSGINYYNNLINGDWGNCPTSGLFIEGSGSLNSNVEVFNNLWLMTYLQENNGIVSITAGGYLRFYNNTVIGQSVSDTCVSISGNSGATLYVENNIVSTCQTLVVTNTVNEFSAWDHNVYGGNNTNPWTDQSIPHWYSTLAAWQAHCSCDSHSAFNSSTSYVGVDSTGHLESGSPAISAGINLTSLNISALDSDMAGLARPGGTTPWDDGPYNFSTAPPPGPPTGLTAVVQ